MLEDKTINFNEIMTIIETRKQNAYRKVNEELILLYMDIGKYLYELLKESNYGDKIIKELANFIKNNYPNMKGFKRRNLYNMINFYKTYKEDEKVLPLVAQLSWTNNLLILTNAKTKEERNFYLKLAIKNNYTKRELERQLKSSYYERYVLSRKNLKKENKKDYPNTLILDTYSLEFLNLPKSYKEKNLKEEILKNMKEFILEIGKEFVFIKDEFKIKVGNYNFYIDLLFYNRELSCLVAFELKVGPFKAEYISKMNLYLEALDQFVKKEHENPSIGVILCLEKDKEVVEYSFNKCISNTLISEYKLKLIDKKRLQAKLKEINLSLN